MSQKSPGEQQVKPKRSGRFGSLKRRLKVKEQVSMPEAYAAAALGSTLGRVFQLSAGEHAHSGSYHREE